MLERFRSFIADAAAAAAQVSGATTIDIDEPPASPASSRKDKKVSRNGVHTDDRSRVEVPKDNDQLKLSELFNVLRVKKPQQVERQETEVRRVRSRHYSESDSDSSSNSELEEVRSCSTALSMTESELDTRRSVSPQHIESPTLKMVASANESQRHSNNRPNSTNNKLEVIHPSQPPRSPRSPKPATRSHVPNSQDGEQNHPVPKPRTPKPKRKNADVGILIDRNSPTNDIQNVDSASIHSNLSAHVAKTKESLEIKHEVEKSRSQNSLNTAPNENELVVRPKVRNNDRHRKSAESLVANSEKDKLRPKSEPFRKSDNDIDKLKNQNGRPQRSSENLCKVANQNLRARNESGDKRDSLSSGDYGPGDGVDDVVQRTGSPYSFSMDSLPSSHPSPIMRRVSFNSAQESSDNDSNSKTSQKDGSEHSGTESVPKEGVEEDFVVEEISKVRFRRVSRGTLQVGHLAKLQISPKKNSSDEIDIQIEQKETQGSSMEFGGGSVDYDEDENIEIPAAHIERGGIAKGFDTIDLSFTPEKIDTNDNDDVVEEAFEKTDRPLDESSKSSDRFFDKLKNLVGLKSQKQQFKDRTDDKVSKVEISELDKDVVTFEMLPKHMTSSVASVSSRCPAEMDSMECMIEGKVKELELERIQRPSMKTPDHHNLSPISPIAHDLVSGKPTNYQLAFMSDLHDNSDDVFIDRKAPDGSQQEGLSKQKKMLVAMGSLDRLLSDQGDIVDCSETDIKLDTEYQDALRYSTEDDPELVDLFEQKHHSIHTSTPAIKYKARHKEKDGHVKSKNNNGSEESSVEDKMLPNPTYVKDDMVVVETEMPYLDSSVLPLRSTVDVKHSDLNESNDGNDTVDAKLKEEKENTKPKLKAMSSLDTLIDQQGSFIDDTDPEFDEDLLESLERQFSEHLTKQHADPSLTREYAYLGMKHETSISSPSKDTEDGFDSLAHKAESFLAAGDTHTIETIKVIEKDKPIQIIQVKAVKSPSTSSDESDMLSVIEEVDDEVDIADPSSEIGNEQTVGHSNVLLSVPEEDNDKLADEVEEKEVMKAERIEVTQTVKEKFFSIFKSSNKPDKYPMAENETDSEDEWQNIESVAISHQSSGQNKTSTYDTKLYSDPEIHSEHIPETQDYIENDDEHIFNEGNANFADVVDTNIQLNSTMLPSSKAEMVKDGYKILDESIIQEVCHVDESMDTDLMTEQRAMGGICAEGTEKCHEIDNPTYEEEATLEENKEDSYLCASIRDSNNLCHSIDSQIDSDVTGEQPDIEYIIQANNPKKEHGLSIVSSENVLQTKDQKSDSKTMDNESEIRPVSNEEPFKLSEKNVDKNILLKIDVLRDSCKTVSTMSEEENYGNIENGASDTEMNAERDRCKSIPDVETRDISLRDHFRVCQSIEEDIDQIPDTNFSFKPIKKVDDSPRDDKDESTKIISGNVKMERRESLKSEVQMILDFEGKLSPRADSDVQFFKEPPIRPPRTRKISSLLTSSTPPTASDSTPTGYTFNKMDSSESEKLGGSRVESPQTVSEGSQDDSGLVSGGSRGTTPEHRRTDSNYSQSSIPSTLSTVTDEEEDIDKLVKQVKQKKMIAHGNRGNLLSVFGDSRESIASYYSDAGDISYNRVPVTGEILFSLNYQYKTGMLEVGIKSCRDIAVVDTRRNRSDPYVKTYLLPDRTRGGKRKTKVKKHTISPTFDETLKYSITKSELENRTLWVTVWHNDRFGRNVFLGEVTINFDYFKFDDPFPKWYPLQERMDSQPSSNMVYKGDLSICIRYVPVEKLGKSSAGRKKEGGKGQLEIMVKEARNLTGVKSNGFSDPFCKGYLLPERQKSSKQKTSVVKKECNPVWNHTFIFEDVSLPELRDRCLELTIWDYEKLASNDFLGGVRLNLGTGLSQGKAVEWMDARGEEMSMWQAMLDRPNIWIDGALILRPNMDKRKF